MDKEWKILMETSPTATWFQSEEAYQCYRACSAWLTPFLVQVHRGKRLVGSLLGYVTKDRCPIKQFFTARAVIFGGPLLAEDITEEELLQLLQSTIHLSPATSNLSPVTCNLSPVTCRLPPVACRLSPAAIYREIRNFRDFSRWRSFFEKAGWTYVPHYDIHIDCGNKEAMINRIHESKMRVIRKMKSEGQTVVEATTEEQVRSWYKQLKHLYKTKVHRPLWPVEFFLAVWRSGYGRLLLVKGDPTGGMFCVQDNKTLYEWYICGQTMVTYGALEWANEHGLECFDLMGAGEPGVPYGVRDFKMQFGGELKELGRYQYIAKPLLYRLGKMMITLSTCFKRSL